jgi:hypothetical protein
MSEASATNTARDVCRHMVTLPTSIRIMGVSKHHAKPAGLVYGHMLWEQTGYSARFVWRFSVPVSSDEREGHLGYSTACSVVASNSFNLGSILWPGIRGES